MAIQVENLQDKVDIPQKMIDLLRSAVTTSFTIENFTIPSEVSVIIVDDDEIRRINHEHRNIDKVTDVLSFPMVEMEEGKVISDEGDFDLDERLLLLGDIIISIETAMRQAEEYGHSLERELAFLTTHGVYHLLGYDHEQEDMEKRMFEKQEVVLKNMGLVRHEK